MTFSIVRPKSYHGPIAGSITSNIHKLTATASPRLLSCQCKHRSCLLKYELIRVITVGREVGINGRLAISKYTKDVNGVKVKMERPLVKLTSFDLLGKKPEADEDMGEVKESATKRKRKTAA